MPKFFIALCLLLAACGNSRRMGELGSPDVRVSDSAGAQVLSFLFGAYHTLEVGDRNVSGCHQSSIRPSRIEFRDPQTQRVVLADEITVEAGADSAGLCSQFKSLVFRGRGFWTKGDDGDHYEFAGPLLANNVVTTFQTSLDLAQVGGPYLLRLKTVHGSFLIFRLQL